MQTNGEDLIKCIFCLESRAGSEEHIFPYAVGGKLTTFRVCKPCNDKLGAGADADLVNHPLCVMQRETLQIPDRDGKIPSFMRKFFSKGVLADEPEQKMQTFINPETGVLEPRLLYRSIPGDSSDGVERKTILIDATEAHRLPKIIQSERKRAGFPPLPYNELQILIARLTEQTHELSQPTVKYPLQIDAFQFRRGLVKIAYEYACLCLGDKYLDDPIAEQMRDYALNDTRHEIKGNAQIGVSPAFQAWASEPNTHLAFAVPNEGCIIIGIRIFSTFSAEILVSRNADAYPGLAQAGGAFTSIDPVSGDVRHSSFEVELSRLA